MVQKFFSNLEDVPMLPADVEIPTKGLDTDEQIDAFDAEPVSYTHLDVYKRQE